MFDRIKDKRKLAEELRRRGHAVPDHEDDSFPSVFQTLMTAEMYSSMSDHFYDSTPTADYSSSVDTSSSFDSGGGFDGGGGASGGAGADGSW